MQTKHLTRSCVLALLALSATAVRARAQCSTGWDERFGAGAPEGLTKACIAWDDGTGEHLYVGGEFTSVGVQPLAFLARWDEGAWSAVGAGVDGWVGALHVHDFGQGPRLVAAGNFVTAGGVAANHIAVWDGASWSALGAGLDGLVLALETHDDGTGAKLYAGGTFTTSGGAPVARLASWNGTSWSAVGGGVNAPVHALESADLGLGAELFAGGEFTAAGVTAVNHVARWNGSAWSALGVGVNAAVRALCSYVPPSSGVRRLYVGGDFQSVGSAPANYLAVWSGSTWSTPWTPPTNYPSNTVRALTVHDDGTGARLYVGGSTLYEDSAVLRSDGVAISWLGRGPGVIAVHALASYHSAGAPRLAAVGAPSAMWTGVTSWDGARWNVLTDANGVFDVRWPSYAYPYKSGVFAVAQVDVGDGPRIYAGGSFTQAGGSLGGNLARWDGAGWQLVGGGIEWPGSSVSGVYALLGFDDGSGAALYAGGLFTDAGGAMAYDLARWNGTSWSGLGIGFDEAVRALAVHDDGSGAQLYAGGKFRYEGSQPVNRIARWNGSGWSGLGGGFSGPVYALASFDDGSGSALYAGGFFAQAGGQPANAIARWNGTSWAPVGGGFGGSTASVQALCAFDDGSGNALYAAGSFTTAGGSPASCIARWNGTSWSPLGAGLDSITYSLAKHDDGTGTALYAGGAFGHAGGVPASNLARWNGTSWSSVAGGVTAPISASVFAVASADAGDGKGPALFVGGSFSDLGGVDAHWVGALHGCRIASFCAGDGLDPDVTTPCPCGNFGAQGRGCAWHAGPSGAALTAQGAIAPTDGLVLVASGMPLSAPSTIFLKGDQLLADGVVFGDGVRCVGGNLIRLGTKTNVNGAAQYPEAGNAPISVRGATPAGSGLTGGYQTYYRNAANYCTSATFNVTNGVRVIW